MEMTESKIPDNTESTSNSSAGIRASDDPRAGVGSRSFLGLLLTQMLGTLNDNMFRWFAIKSAQDQLGDSEALVLGIAVFTLPYLLLAVYAGFLADRFSKRSVIVWCKVAEIVVMAMGIAAILSGNLYFLFTVVFMMGAQSALFTPSKYGGIPEIVSPENLSKANGLMGLVTVSSSAIGGFIGFMLFDHCAAELLAGPSLLDLWVPASAMMGVAVVGLVSSLLIRQLHPANPNRQCDVNFPKATFRDLKLLGSDMALMRTALGIAFFWAIAALAQSNIDLFGSEILKQGATGTGALMPVLIAGVAIGSVLAGFVSGGKVELGLVPLGALGITLSSLLLWIVGAAAPDEASNVSFYLTCVCLFGLGASAGLFDIPLESFLQHKSDDENRGTVIAATNFLTFSMIMVSAGLLHVFTSVLNLSPDQIFMVAGLGTIPVIIYSFKLLPQATIRFIVWLLTTFVYRVKIVGKENIPEKGGALLVANHVTWLDGLLLVTMSERPVRMLAYADYVGKGFAGYICRTFGVIPIKGDGGPKALLRSLKAARQAAIDGDVVCIFAEGEITRTGQLQPFQRGMTRIIEGTGVPVIPTYLDQLWGSIFSYHSGKFFWKKPISWPYPLTIMFGEPLNDPDNVYEVRQAVEQLGVAAVEHRDSLIPARQFLRSCRSARGRSKSADSSGMDLTGGKFLTASLVFRKVLQRHYIPDDEKFVGILLPPSVGGAITNAALTLMGKVTVNLNYTLTDEVNNFCIKEAGIKRIVTSKKFLEKKPTNVDAEFIYVEDLKEKVTKMDKISSLVSAMVEPISMLEKRLGLTKIDPNEEMTIIFTSGSTGEPKGVMLTHNNVSSNVAAADQLFQITEEDCFLGVLPFFHSFGFSLMMWLPLMLKPKAVYHFNPLDARTVGKLCEKHSVTVLAATPTFMKGYMKRCTVEQMKALDLAIVGAEKMPQSLADEFQAKFGVLPTEGYGTTELSPLAAANVPDHRNNAAGTGQTAFKAGTVGRPVANVAAKTVDPDTGEAVGLNNPGLLYIKGPNVMKGYLNRPDKTAEVINDGWYNTGDIAIIDDEGFISITGRLSRFSKIGGEMVPHIKIEEELIRLIDVGDEEEPTVKVAVASVPDEKKGERIIVLHKPMENSIESILQGLSDAGLPNLWIPSADSFVEVEEIPLLGTGKLDLRGIKDKAAELFP
jgi:acyl-[acyl-carrier-protein]-phospholipid O-acyltransferase / long-chain-fatty-acid--[acyl-carrier-protein] ligase